MADHLWHHCIFQLIPCEWVTWRLFASSRTYCLMESFIEPIIEKNWKRSKVASIKSKSPYKHTLHIRRDVLIVSTHFRIFMLTMCVQWMRNEPTLLRAYLMTAFVSFFPSFVTLNKSKNVLNVCGMRGCWLSNIALKTKPWHFKKCSKRSVSRNCIYLFNEY